MEYAAGTGSTGEESVLPRKDGAMHLFMLALWLSTAVWLNPRLVSLCSGAPSFFALLTLVLFVICLNIFWLFGSYYVAIFVFSFLGHRRTVSPSRLLEPRGKVAVFYLTRNDFKYEAALSCVRLQHDAFHVFILDDSTDPGSMRDVDVFHSEYPKITTVIRREGRQGFKAGSLNNALRNHAIDFPYFAVIDADGVTPPDFLTKLLPYFAVDKTVGFVQGSQRPNPRQKSRFASDLAPGILPLWTTYYPPRNKYGLVLFLGHGGIVRRDVWELVGGFPEISAEDLAFSTKAREHGYQGWFTDDACSLEDFPESYKQLRGQQERYTKGGCEFLASGQLQSFLRSPIPAWFEKLDLALWVSTLFLPILYLVFLLVFAVLMPLSFARPETLEVSLFGSNISLWRVFPLSDRIHAVWTWDFYLITLIHVFAPVLGSLRQLIPHPLRTIRLMFLSCVPYLSLSLVSMAAVLSYFTTRHVEWNVTGERSSGATRQAGRSDYSFASAHVGHSAPAVLVLEILLGATLSAALLLTLNTALMVYALSILLGPVLLKARWENGVLAAVLPLPYLLLIASMGALGANLWGMQGMFYMFFPFHL